MTCFTLRQGELRYNNTRSGLFPLKLIILTCFGQFFVCDMLHLKARGVEVQQQQIWPFSTKTHHFDLFLANFLFVTCFTLRQGQLRYNNSRSGLFPLKLIILTCFGQFFVCDILHLKARGVEVQQHQIWPFSTKTHHFDLFWPTFCL